MFSGNPENVPLNSKETAMPCARNTSFFNACSEKVPVVNGENGSRNFREPSNICRKFRVRKKT
jgi:hypothetical protein